MIGQRRGGDDHALHHAVPAPGRRQRRDDLHRFAQAHLVGQNASHARLVERQHPRAAALLIGRELAPQAAGHIAQIRLRVAAQRPDGVLHAAVGLHLRASHAQHAHHVGRAVRAEADLPRFVASAGIIQGGGVQQLLHHGSQGAHVAYIQKFACFQPHILLPLGDGAHHRQELRHGLALLQQLKHQPPSAHMEGSARRKTPGLDLLKRRGGIDLAQPGQLRHTLGAELEDLLGALEHDMPAAHHEARIRKEVQQRALGAAVPKQQASALRQGGLIPAGGGKGIDNRIPIVEFHPRLHIAPDQVQIGGGFQGRGFQSLRQLGRGRDRTHGGQGGQKRRQGVLRLARGIAELRPLLAQQPANPGLRAVQMCHAPLPEHVARIRADQPQAFHALGAHGQFCGRKRDRKAQGQLDRAYIAVHDFFFIDQQPKGMVLKIP